MRPVRLWSSLKRGAKSGSGASAGTEGRALQVQRRVDAAQPLVPGSGALLRAQQHDIEQVPESTSSRRGAPGPTEPTSASAGWSRTSITNSAAHQLRTSVDQASQSLVAQAERIGWWCCMLESCPARTTSTLRLGDADHEGPFDFFFGSRPGFPDALRPLLPLKPGMRTRRQPGGRRPKWLLLALFAWSCGRSEPQQTNPAAPLAGKNVLIVLLDACTVDHLAAYGYERDTTPYLTGFAARNVVFEDVTAAAPYTIASVASLMTGEAVDLHGVTEAGAEVSAALPMLAERFAAAGYATAAFSANAHVQERFGFGRGFAMFRGFWPKLDADHHVPEQQRKAVGDWLESAARDPRPFFGYVHLLPPHAPYDPPAADRARFAGHLAGTPLDAAGSLANLTPLSRAARVPDAAEDQAIRDLYDASLEHVDGVLAELDARLAALGLTENTLVLVLSDHGEAFGQHGVWQHARTVFEEMVRVPMIWRLPTDTGLVDHGRIAVEVALIDVVPTLIELCALPGKPPYSSVSVAALLRDEPLPSPHPPILTRTAGPREHIAIKSGRYKLIHQLPVEESGASGIWQFFDLGADPREEHSFATAEEAPTPPLEEAYRQLRRGLKSQRAELRARARATAAVEIDAATQAELNKIGY